MAVTRKIYPKINATTFGEPIDIGAKAENVIITQADSENITLQDYINNMEERLKTIIVWKEFSQGPYDVPAYDDITAQIIEDYLSQLETTMEWSDV